MDTPQQTTPPSLDKRQHKRHAYQRRLFLDFPGQPSLAGCTRNVCLSGTFLQTDFPPQGIAVGREGFLRMETKHSLFHLPCKVVYVTGEGLALDLLGQEAAFVLALAMDACEHIAMPTSAQVGEK